MIRTIAAASLFVLFACDDKSQPASDKPSDVPAVASSASAPAAPATSAVESPPPRPTSIPAPPDVATPPADASKTPSGLVTKVLAKGTGKDHPSKKDKVKVDYTGWTREGHMFDSTIVKGQSASIKLSDMPKGWSEGVQLMVAGEKRRLWIPAELAFGAVPRGGGPAGQLTFDVELLEIFVPGKPPPAPPDVKAPPKDATKTASGLAFKVLKKGSGEATPSPTSTVTVNYTGWTTDGKVFESSIPDGEPLTFSMARVIKGWVEGLQLMHVGDAVRFWIPASLGYGDKPEPGRPAGMLVFDIELLSIR